MNYIAFLRQKSSLLAVCVVATLLLGSWHLLFSPPAGFSSGVLVSVARGASATDVSQELFDAHIIRHPRVLRFLFRILGTEGALQAGAYRFNTPENLFVVAYRLVAGIYGLPPVRITFFEGETVRDLSEKIAEEFPLISQEDFLKEGKPYEGYLFPDTYLFSPSVDATLIITTMRENFNAKIASLSHEIDASLHSLSDIVILASLVEREARTSVNKRIVAGILWDRLALGMPLQVDAVFGYIHGRDTYSPSFADLKVDSPYNTYIHTGLPPGPIDSPGLDSLLAALYPTKTDYLYYLTGTDNLMHYATTYTGHQANQRKYLR